jgi:hypothetical protein
MPLEDACWNIHDGCEERPGMGDLVMHLKDVSVNQPRYGRMVLFTSCTLSLIPHLKSCQTDWTLR